MADEELPTPDPTPEDSEETPEESATGLMAPGNVARELVNISIEDEMRESYLTYAMSTIISRALPDVRDGLKPVQRRILVAMRDLNVTPNSQRVKSAKIVGEVMGNYHPHGDAAIYATMVRMAQDFSMRYRIVDGQGNFGSIDNDPPAAQRYTEARMSPIAVEMLQDIDRETVDMIENYDQSKTEPAVLPGKFPNFLCNGGSGIAVGMATNVPPHNLREVCDAAAHLLDNPAATLDEIMTFIKGPDFPTAGMILGVKGIRQAYETGRGSIIMQAKTAIEPYEGGRNQIIITELPYQVIKSRLIEQIADLVKQKKIEGITAVDDHSDKTGMRVTITLKREAFPKKVLNFLLKHTPLRTTFGVNMLALVDGQPRLLSVIYALQCYLDHRREIIRRRTIYDLNKARDRTHILEGLQIALDFLDEIIALIRRSRTAEIARSEMIANYGLTFIQATAILNMQLRQLTGLAREELENEYKGLLRQIGYLEDILVNPARVRAIIKEELKYLRDKFGDERRTRIVPMEAEEIGDEDLIPEEEMIISITRDGYIKRVPKDTYPTQHRGGKGRIGASTKEEDTIQHLFIATTHHYILFFTDRGRVYKLKAYEVPQTSRTAMGTAVVNLINIQPGERVTATLPLKDFRNMEGYLFLATEMGEVKRTKLSEFANLRNNGLIVFDIEENDALRWVAHTSGSNEIILVTRKGMSIRFPEEDVPSRGRAAGGVRGIRLSEEKGDLVVGMGVVDDALELLVIGELGISKRTPLTEYRSQGRGGTGIKTMALSPKTGEVVDAKIVTPEDRLLIMTRDGITIRLLVGQIRSSDRNTQGVKAITLDGDDRVASVERITADKVEGSDESGAEKPQQPS
jgi:DNA gyrase subunit A